MCMRAIVCAFLNNNNNNNNLLSEFSLVIASSLHCNYKLQNYKLTDYTRHTNVSKQTTPLTKCAA